MAIDVCSENSGPRISFSHDLNQKDPGVPQFERRLDSSLLDSSSDFEFCIGNSIYFQELSSADELFSNGKILPVEIKKKKQVGHQPAQPPPSSSPSPHPNQILAAKKRLKEYLSTSLDDANGDEEEYDDKPVYKSFWQFKRSSSLNFDSTRSKSLINSLHFLSRSNSTGSALSKESQRQNLQRQPSGSRKSKVSRSAGSYYSYFNNTTRSSSTQKPPLKKNCGSYNNNNGNNNGVRISPVLNIPPPHISYATVNLFGLGSLFCNGKIKRKKR
ncbi:uncharacterized protein LOC123216227 [Mangifera indica]|uniref:uncharacterized protein LOC123216227 n=1 Tax=Mangifera indica TaxID=29780 RepID=UPI001CFBED40|nr:uncharacterized protein LOC123216227 [Mangifera indica]